MILAKSGQKKHELINPKEVIPETIIYGKFVTETIFDKVIYRIPLRWCKQERETTQVLGLRIPDRKKMLVGHTLKDVAVVGAEKLVISKKEIAG